MHHFSTTDVSEATGQFYITTLAVWLTFDNSSKDIYLKSTPCPYSPVYVEVNICGQVSDAELTRIQQFDKVVKYKCPSKFMSFGYIETCFC
jgi:hypothetical protein